MVDKILKFLLLVSPIAFIAKMPLKHFESMFFYVGVILLFVASLYDTKIREMPGKKFIPLLAGCCLVNILLHSFRIEVVCRSLDIILAVITTGIIVQYCKKPKECYKYIVIAGCLNIAMFALQRIGFTTQLVPPGAIVQAGGFMGNGPRLMTYLAIILPYMLNAGVIFFALCIIASIFGTEYSLLGIAVLILIIKKKRIFWIIGLVGGLVICLIFKDKLIGSFFVRFDIWKNQFAGFIAQPLSGYGLNVSPFGQVAKSGVDMATWNSYLTFIFGIGILGILPIIAVFKKFIKNFSISVECIGILALILLSMIEYPLEIVRLWITISAMVGFYLISIQNKEVHSG